MNRTARTQDDLFDNSVMTFGEHLEELRHCLVKSIICLGIGLAFGLIFANRVVQFVSVPVQHAIEKFHVDRDMAMLGYADSDDPKVLEFGQFLTKNALQWELVYPIPKEYLNSDAIEKMSADDNENEDTSTVETDTLESDLEQDVVIEATDIAKMLKKLPTRESLEPQIQLRRSKTQLSSFKMEEPFLIWIKAGLVVGAIFSSPFVFYYIWNFVAAGLYSHERKYVYVYLPFSVVLFISGVVLAFFLVLQYVLNFLLAFNGSMDVAVEPRLTYYLNFVLLLPLGFGVAFQLPLVMLFLQRIGLVETEAFISGWKVAVLAIAVISMLLTPADVTSMVALAIPLIILYALGIVMCKFIPRGRGLGSAAYDPA